MDEGADVIVVFVLGGVVLVRGKKVDFVDDFVVFLGDCVRDAFVGIELLIVDSVVEEVESEFIVG